MVFCDTNVITVTISKELAKRIHSIYLNDPNYEDCIVFTEIFF